MVLMRYERLLQPQLTDPRLLLLIRTPPLLVRVRVRTLLLLQPLLPTLRLPLPLRSIPTKMALQLLELSVAAQVERAAARPAAKAAASGERDRSPSSWFP